MRPVTTYLEYRSFLRDHYESRKEETGFFSYRFMSQKLDIDPGQLVKILQGKLHLPQRSMQAVLKLCRLEGREAEYFEELVKFCRARTREETNRCFERLALLRGVDVAAVDGKQAEFYRKWHHTVIRSLLGLGPFSGDAKALGDMCVPPVTAQEAAESIELLESLGLVVRDPQDALVLAASHISPSAGVPVEAVRAFQRDTLHLAGRALEEIPREEREISTITVALSGSDLETVRGWVGDLKRQIQNLATNSPDPDKVYHLNVQLFPVGHRPRKRAGST
jgi:uncharacterized protein (TIGR02147 family)